VIAYQVAVINSIMTELFYLTYLVAKLVYRSLDIQLKVTGFLITQRLVNKFGIIRDTTELVLQNNIENGKGQCLY